MHPSSLAHLPLLYISCILQPLQLWTNNRLLPLRFRSQRAQCSSSLAFPSVLHLRAALATQARRVPDLCYDHALLVTGYDVLLSTLQGNLSFSTSSASSFASTHAGPDFSSSRTLRLRHHALSDS